MTFHDIIGYLDPAQISSRVIHNETAFISIAAPLSTLSVQRIDSAAYITTSAELKAYQPEQLTGLNLIVLGSLSQLSESVQSACQNIVCLGSDADPKEIIQIVQRGLQRGSVYEQNMRALTSNLIHNRGLSVLLDTSAHILQNPVFLVVWTDGCLKTSMLPDSLTQNSRLNDIIEELRTPFQTPQTVTQSGLFNAERQHKNKSIPDTGIIETNNLFHCRQISLFLHIHGVEIGFVTCLECQHPFTELVPRDFRAACAILTQEVQKNHLFTESKGDIKASFLKYLLSDSFDDFQLHERTRLVESAFHLNGTYYVILIRNYAPNGQSDPMSLSVIYNHLKLHRDDYLYLMENDEIILLLNLESEIDVRNFMHNYFGNYVDEGDLYIGVSNRFHNLSQVKRHYVQAQKAIHIGEVKETRCITFFQDVSTIAIMENLSQDGTIEDYCQPEVLDLLKIDQLHNTELVLTLMVYLDTGCNTKLSAERLHIHKNTLLYRMNRIKEILNHDFTTDDYIFKLMVSIRVLRTKQLFLIYPSTFDNYGTI